MLVHTWVLVWRSESQKNKETVSEMLSTHFPDARSLPDFKTLTFGWTGFQFPRAGAPLGPWAD